MIKVLLVDDHPLVRHGLTELLTGTDDIRVVAAVEDGDQAAAAAVEHQPDVVLMDLSMQRMDGIAATRALLAELPAARVIVLTSFSESERIHDALDAGAIGYLLKDSEPEDVVRAVRDAAAGDSPLSPRAARALLPQNRRPGRTQSDALSAREREVLALVAAGLPNKSIARRLDISEKPVKAHLTRVFSVLGVSDRTSAALWAQRHGVIA
jgi:DNA-binding NarL/FixJ family response regulator